MRSWLSRRVAALGRVRTTTLNIPIYALVISQASEGTTSDWFFFLFTLYSWSLRPESRISNWTFQHGVSNMVSPVSDPLVTHWSLWLSLSSLAIALYGLYRIICPLSLTTVFVDLALCLLQSPIPFVLKSTLGKVPSTQTDRHTDIHTDTYTHTWWGHLS